MARLFLTQREMNFIADIGREVIQDCVGQKLYYYPISELKTLAHPIYNEALQKIYDNPIIIDALVQNVQQEETKIDSFGIDTVYKLEAFIHYRDMIEKGINVCIGDVVTYGDNRYEIIDVTIVRNIYGQIENKDGIKINCVKARESFATTSLQGPTDISYSDDDAVQKQFYQQRGFEENQEGKIDSRRANQENGNLEKPEDGPREVSERGDDANTDTTSFYDE